jgi:hypothetical protein
MIGAEGVRELQKGFARSLVWTRDREVEILLCFFGLCGFQLVFFIFGEREEIYLVERETRCD